MKTELSPVSKNLSSPLLVLPPTELLKHFCKGESNCYCDACRLAGRDAPEFSKDRVSQEDKLFCIEDT